MYERMLDKENKPSLNKPSFKQPPLMILSIMNCFPIRERVLR